MKIRNCKRYIADCGKGFWSKAACLDHEENCRCWTNPAFKTCKTCKFNREYIDSNGMGESPYLHTWRAMECTNPEFDYDTHFNQAHEKAPDLCVNCSKWEWVNGDWDKETKTWVLRK